MKKETEHKIQEELVKLEKEIMLKVIKKGNRRSMHDINTEVMEKRKWYTV